MSGDPKPIGRVEAVGWFVRTARTDTERAGTMLADLSDSGVHHDDNARRVAALWNAALDAGLSTEALEEGGVQRAFLSLGRIVDRIGELVGNSLVGKVNVLTLAEAMELRDEAMEALIRARLHACDGNHRGAPCADAQCWKR